MRTYPNLGKIRDIHLRVEEIREKLGENPKPSKPFIEVLRESSSVKKQATDVRTNDKSLDEEIKRIAAKWNLDNALVRAVIHMESGGNSKAISSKGAMGLMQLMPLTAKEMGVDDPFDPIQNIEGGTKYLALLLQRYDNNLDFALAAYNAGPSRVDVYGGIPPFKETERFVKNVKSLYARFRKGDG